MHTSARSALQHARTHACAAPRDAPLPPPSIARPPLPALHCPRPQVRDARIPIATNHPQVPSWVGPKPMLLVMNRVDMVGGGRQPCNTMVVVVMMRGCPGIGMHAPAGQARRARHDAPSPFPSG